MKKAVYFASLLFVFVACKHRPAANGEVVRKIDFSEYFKMAGHPKKLTVEIDSSLTFRFMGLEGCGKDSGVVTGKITRGAWDTINAYLNKINYKTLDTAYNKIGVLEDTRMHIGLTFTIYYGKSKKHIVADAWGTTVTPPQSLLELEYYLTRPVFSHLSPMFRANVQNGM